MDRNFLRFRRAHRGFLHGHGAFFMRAPQRMARTAARHVMQWMREPMPLPPLECGWPRILIDGDHYVSMTGEIVYLRNGRWQARGNLTPPPR